jgi:2-polyprenyl-3-methyl-5-hydroxy-6-metoxy-1,4-benzoquinol methylase
MGVRFSEKTLDSRATWEQIKRSGEADIRDAMASTHFRHGSPLSALEIGCGLGRLTASLAPLFGKVEAYDISEEMIHEVRRIYTDRHVQFGITNGKMLFAGKTDSIFSAEVFHHLIWQTIKQHASDSFRLLKHGGQLVVQMNSESPRLLTRVSKSFRGVLYFFGVKYWKGWPTNPNFGRRYRSEAELLALYQCIGFNDVKRFGSNPRQFWFVGTKK